MNNYERMAELLFPNINKTNQDLEKIYPIRKKNPTVTRFAPSPTGFLHIGGVYTALINRSLASGENDVFMLRLEDTDKKREVAGSRKIICDIFNKLGLKIDEGVVNEFEEVGEYGPYVQSERVEIYHIMAKYLVQKGYAYPCFCTEEDLAQIREQQQALKVTPGYYGSYAKYRNITVEEAQSLIEQNKNYVLRFRVSEDAPLRVTLSDLIRGDIEMENNFNDFVLLKENGIPTYHFAHACDDHFMRTTHVIRGEEWMASFPIHKQLFEALDFALPLYAHVAPVMKQEGESRRKLSKRKDPEANAEFYLQEGYPNKALFVYLYTLINSNFEEWYLANKDASLNDFKVSFDNMQLSGALYDLSKLNSISSEIIYEYDEEENTTNVINWAQEFNQELYNRLNNDRDFVLKLMKTQGKNSMEHRKDLTHYGAFMDIFGIFYDDVFASSQMPLDTLYENIKKEDLKTIIDGFKNYFNSLKSGEEITLKDLAKELGYTDKKKFAKNPEMYRGVVFQFYKALRLLLTHSEHGISMDDVISVLGHDRIMERLEKGYQYGE